MTAPSPRVPARRRSRWVQAAVAAVAVLLLGGFGGVAATRGIGERPPRLTADLLGAISTADVVDVKPAVAARPAEPDRPIDVPKDPYAKEDVVEIGRIEIPKLGLDHKLMHGVTLNNIDQGPSHWPGSAMPGHAGNVVVAGHRVTHTHPFRNVDRLVQGDQVIVTAGGVRATYAVLEVFVVTPAQMGIVEPTEAPVLTLFACHPPGSARQRIVVRAELVGSAAA